MDYSQKIDGSKYFTWHEALWLPSWQIHHNPSEEEKSSIISTAKVMDTIRDYINSPIVVHVWIRPILNNSLSSHNGQDYNAFIKGASNSAHKRGDAVDWHPITMSIDDAKAKLLIKLEEFNIRMERGTTTWIHIDTEKPNPNRYFNP